jgi:hypothetical protein
VVEGSVQALGGAAATSDENKTGQTGLRSLSVTKRFTKRLRNLFVMLTHRKHSADFAQIYRMQPSTPTSSLSLSLSTSALYVLALSPCGDETTPSQSAMAELVTFFFFFFFSSWISSAFQSRGTNLVARFSSPRRLCFVGSVFIISSL